MNSGRQILPECYGDTTLIEILGFKKTDHQGSISKVLATLNEPKRFSLTLIGIIDDDKKKPVTINEFVKLDETPNLVKLKHPDRNHYLMVLKPALEIFLLKAAEEAEVDTGRFFDKKYFKEVCKSQKVSENQQFRQFVNSIKQKKKDSCLKTLHNWLTDLVGADY